MSVISIIGCGISIDAKKIFSAPSRLDIVHILNGKILFLYDHSDLVDHGPDLIFKKKVTSPENLEAVNRNILMIDTHGEILWRIRSDSYQYNPWTVVALDEFTPTRWYVSTYEGYQFDLDIETGVLSNKIFMR